MKEAFEGKAEQTQDDAVRRPILLDLVRVRLACDFLRGLQLNVSFE